jgi:hypothetical protein
MNRDEKAFARVMFKHKVVTSDGQAYEDLFVDIMSRGNPDFIGVKPQGSIGDRKNDGYDRRRGSYYQVFAPEDPKLKSQDAVKKLNKDFTGLMKHWDKVTPVKEFHFVFNDKYNGSFPTIETDLATIKTKHKLAECASFLAKHLEDKLFVLTDDQVITVVGFIPDTSKFEKLDYTVLNEVIAQVLKHKVTLEPTQLLSAPDFSEKIKFNGLSLHTSRLLNAASYQVGILDKYFELNSDFTKQELRDTINDLYKEALAKKLGPYAGVSQSDLVFLDILKSIAPNHNLPIWNAALVVMAYFFESCDIFEDPNSGASI